MFSYELPGPDEPNLLGGKIGRGSLGPEIFGFLEDVLSLGSAKLPKLEVWGLERGLGERENHFLGAALLRKEVNEEVDGEGAGGKDTAELDGFTDELT